MRKIITILILLTRTAFGQEIKSTDSMGTSKPELKFPMTGYSLQDTVFDEHWKYRSYSIIFKYGKGDIHEKSFCFLDSVGDFMKKNPNLIIKVVQHGDRTPDKYCMKLGSRRARAVVDYLVKECGIDPRRLISQSMSNLEPIIPQEEINKETNKERRMRMERINLRTEFVIIGKIFNPNDAPNK